MILEVKGQIAILTLNRPEQHNAITGNMYFYELPRAFEEIRRNDEIRVLILTGAGRAFCSGGDMSALNDLDIPDHPRYLHLAPTGFFIKDLYAMEKPIISAVNGAAAGAGLSLAVACDFRIASRQARFGATFIQRGMMPDCGLTYTLPQTIGISRALRLILLGEIIDAAEAERIGLVDKVVPPDDLLPVSMELAAKLTKLPPMALGLIKRAIYRPLISELSTQLDFEGYGQNLLFKTEDFQEGIKSFLEKREPIFRGR
jgi:2-(1,2-epoxy-1,2-dihydrophenyl)acetyl-CoA isomerase